MEVMKYHLNDYDKVSFEGFNYTIPEETMKLISALSMEVGSPTYIHTPTFQKKPVTGESNIFGNTNTKNIQNKKRKGNKGMEITNDDWETIRTFQATKLEQKTGIDTKIDSIRLLLNKLSDKTFLDMKEQIIRIIEELLAEEMTAEEMLKIGNTIFEIASANKFYSVMYASLYAELIQRYEFLKPVFQKSFDDYSSIFKDVQSVDPNENYDLFCKITKQNEKRKAISMFFVNLTLNQVITAESLLMIMRELVVTMLGFIQEENKKNEVDELTENIVILYSNDILKLVKTPDGGFPDYLLIDGKSISDIIIDLAKSKSKDYKSLSNKSIFKYMDLMDL